MRLTVNGLEQEIAYDRHAIEDLLAPLLRNWMDKAPGVGRHYAFLAAPPGTGKSTIAMLLERYFGNDLQCLGIDGFHYRQEVLDSTNIRDKEGREVPLASIKGAPETFDVKALDRLLTRSYGEDVGWPLYDRVRHDVVADGTTVTAHHILLEGNWLLLDEDPWRSIVRYAEVAIFIGAPRDLLRNRLVGRKVAGGLSLPEAEAFYLRTDGPNVERVLTRSNLDSVDLLLAMDANGALYERKKS